MTQHSLLPPRVHDHGTDEVQEALTRLAREFPILSPRTIARVVRGSRSDLSGVPSGALPELLERLARQRLQDRLHTPAPRSPADR